MKDNDLFTLLINQINIALTSFNWSYPIIQLNQPVQQGVVTGGNVFVSKLFDVPYGFPESEFNFNSTDQKLYETTTQHIESHFQISAMIQQVPGDLTTPTSSDVVTSLQVYLSSATNVNVFNNSQVGILRIRHITNPYFDDDKSQFQAFPYFEIIFTHEREVIISVPYFTTVTGKVYPII